VAGLDRGVGGEDALLAGLGGGLGEGEARRHFFADQFQGKEGGVAFVHVEDARLDAQRAQEPHPAHPQQDLLHDAHGVVAAIDPAGQVAVMLGVFRAVGVQQIDDGAPDVDLPGVEKDLGQVNVHHADQRLALAVQHRFERQVARVEQGVMFGLPVVLVDGLLEIALAIEEADAGKPRSRSLADLAWSPANMPRPPAAMGRVS
jgi:hypothetical protein